MALFSRDVRQASAPPAQRRLKSWGSQVKGAKEFEKGMALSHSSVTDSDDILDQDVLSLESSDPANSMLLAPSSKDEADVVK